MLDDGRIVVPVTKKFADSLFALLCCVDPRTPQDNFSWVNPVAKTPLTLPVCVVGKMLYVGTGDARIIAFSTEDGLAQWAFPTISAVRTELTAAQGLLLFCTVDSRFQALDLVTQALRWSLPSVSPSPYYHFLTRVAVRGGQALWGMTWKKGSQGSIHCHDLATGEAKWVVPAAGAVTSDPVTGGGLVFFGTANGLLTGYDMAGRPALQIQTGGAIVGAAACDERYVYVGSTDGTFYARALQDGVQPREWRVPVTGSIGTHVLISDGDACFGGVNASGQSAFYTLDLASAASQTPRVLVEGLHDRLLLAPEVNRGRITFADSGLSSSRLYAVHLDEKGMLERVLFSSNLIVDEYDVSGSTAAATNPAFQMSATILDEQQVPMPNVRVSLWAATPLSLVCNGQAINLGDNFNGAVSVEADTNGLLNMTAPGDVELPSLFLCPDFFLPSYSLEVFPDQQNLNRLASVTGGELTNARGYDGADIVLPAYAGTTEAIASSVRNTIGLRHNTGAAAFTTASTSVPPTVGRGLNAGAVPSWTTDIQANQVTFAPLSPNEIEQWFGATRQVAVARQGFGSFLKNVVHGTEKASKVVWHYAEDSASVVVHTAEAEYEFIARTVHEAVQVVKSVIGAVVTSIEKFIEWLSFLFDWDDIVATQKAIVAEVDTTFNALSAWIDGQLATAAAGVKALIEGWKSTAAAAFGTVPPQVAGKTPGSIQQSAGPPSMFFRPRGIDITVPSQWLMKKVHANLTVLPGLPGEAELAALFDAYVLKVTSAIATDPALQQLPADLTAVITSFATLCSNPGGFPAQAMDVVVQVFADLVDVGLDLLETMVVALLEFARDAVRLLRTMLSATIEIPFVSDFYRAVAGSDLSLFNLVSLGLAVPATLTYKIEQQGLSFPFSGQDAKTATTALEISSAIAYIPMVPFWSLVVLPEDKTFNRIFNGAIAADLCILMGLQAGQNGIDRATAADWTFLVTQILQPIMFGKSVAVAGTSKQAEWDAESPKFFAFLGAFSATLAAVYAGIFPDDYLDDGKAFSINFLCSVALFSPLLYESFKGEVGAAVFLLLNYTCYMTAGSLTLIGEFTS
jgi:outer membrane protein assembly factor BamB